MQLDVKLFISHFLYFNFFMSLVRSARRQKRIRCGSSGLRLYNRR